MDFDFYEIYKGFSTMELLKIVQRPEGYQPEAIEAASRHLSERKVDPEGEAAVQDFYEKSDWETAYAGKYPNVVCKPDNTEDRLWLVLMEAGSLRSIRGQPIHQKQNRCFHLGDRAAGFGRATALVLLTLFQLQVGRVILFL